MKLRTIVLGAFTLLHLTLSLTNFYLHHLQISREKTIMKNQIEVSQLLLQHAKVLEENRELIKHLTLQATHKEQLKRWREGYEMKKGENQ